MPQTTSDDFCISDMYVSIKDNLFSERMLPQISFHWKSIKMGTCAIIPVFHCNMAHITIGIIMTFRSHLFEHIIM